MVLSFNFRDEEKFVVIEKENESGDTVMMELSTYEAIEISKLLKGYFSK